jgi:hypothetical protein
MMTEAKQPSDKAMRFVIKWHSALGLDEFASRVLARAIDELLQDVGINND